MPPKKFNPKKATPQDIIAAIKAFNPDEPDIKPEQLVEAMNQCVARGNATADLAQAMFEEAQSSNIFTESQLEKLSKSLSKADSKKAKAAAADKKSSGGSSSGFFKEKRPNAAQEDEEEDEDEEEEEGESGLGDLVEDEAGLIMMSDRNFKKTLRDLKESDREARFLIVRDKLSQQNPNIGQILFLAHTFGIFQDFSVDEQAMMREWSEKQVEEAAYTGPHVVSMFLWCPTLAEDQALVRRVLSASLEASNMAGIVALTRTMFYSPMSAASNGAEIGSDLFKSGGVIARFLSDRSVVPDAVDFMLSYLESLVSMRQEHRKPSLTTADAMLRLLVELLAASTDGTTAPAEPAAVTAISDEHKQRAKAIFDKGRWSERPRSFHRRMKELFGVFVERKGKSSKSRKPK